MRSVVSMSFVLRVTYGVSEPNGIRNTQYVTWLTPLSRHVVPAACPACPTCLASVPQHGVFIYFSGFRHLPGRAHDWQGAPAGVSSQSKKSSHPALYLRGRRANQTRGGYHAR